MFLFLALSLFLFTSTHGQANYNSLFGNNDEPTKVNYYLSASCDLYKILDKPQAFTGLEGGIIVNRHVVLGFFGKGSFFNNDNSVAPDYYSMGMGGFSFGYLFMPDKIVNIETKIETGYGSLSTSNEKITFFEEPDVMDSDVFFYCSPSVVLNVNITKSIKLYLGIGSNNIYTDAGNIFSDEKLSRIKTTFGITVHNLSK